MANKEFATFFIDSGNKKRDCGIKAFYSILISQSLFGFKDRIK